MQALSTLSPIDARANSPLYQEAYAQYILKRHAGYLYSHTDTYMHTHRYSFSNITSDPALSYTPLSVKVGHASLVNRFTYQSTQRCILCSRVSYIRPQPQVFVVISNQFTPTDNIGRTRIPTASIVLDWYTSRILTSAHRLQLSIQHYSYIGMSHNHLIRIERPILFISTRI